MKDIPISFSAPMVRAVRADLKTETRRILKEDIGPWLAEGNKLRWGVGDSLWVKEQWAVDGPLDQVQREHEDMMPGIGHGPYYRADPVHEDTGLIWRSSRFMPRWASRITLEVMAVRIERLQAIDEAGAKAEGIFYSNTFQGWTSGNGADETADYHRTNPVVCFTKLWATINGDEAWLANPWVAVISFRRLK